MSLISTTWRLRGPSAARPARSTNGLAGPSTHARLRPVLGTLRARGEEGQLTLCGTTSRQRRAYTASAESPLKGAGRRSSSAGVAASRGDPDGTVLDLRSRRVPG